MLWRSTRSNASSSSAQPVERAVGGDEAGPVGVRREHRHRPDRRRTVAAAAGGVRRRRRRAPVMPCQLWAKPTTSHPPVDHLGQPQRRLVGLGARSSAAAPSSAPAPAPPSASARSITGRDSIPEKRWSRRPIISVTTATISGWEWPRIGAHLPAREVEHLAARRRPRRTRPPPARRRTATTVAP